MIKSLRLPEQNIAPDISSMVELLEQHPNLWISCKTDGTCWGCKVYRNNCPKCLAYCRISLLKVEDPKCKQKLNVSTKYQVISKIGKKVIKRVIQKI